LFYLVHNFHQSRISSTDRESIFQIVHEASQSFWRIVVAALEQLGCFVAGVHSSWKKKKKFNILSQHIAITCGI